MYYIPLMLMCNMRHSWKTFVAIFANQSSLTITNCSFFKNMASSNNKNKSVLTEYRFAGIGGTMLSVSSILKIFQSRFQNNFAALQGGSLYCVSSSCVIRFSVFQNRIDVLLGGGIINSSLIIENSWVKNNSVLDKANGSGRGLLIFMNSNATIWNVCLKIYLDEVVQAVY